MSAILGMGAGVSSQVSAQEGADQLEEVVVTGSRILKANLVTSSPVTELDAEQIELTGVTRIEDVLNSMPQVYLDQSAGQSIESQGTATAQLRNLGVSRTLVLMNGRRLPANSPLSSESGADLNLIPTSLVKRVEILTGGASSTYGSDAVAGVVNFVMMDDFEGIKIDYQHAAYRHDNSGNAPGDATVAAGFPVPDGVQNDGDIDDITIMLGGNFDNGRGNITAWGTYREIEPVLQGDRDYSACAVRRVSDGSLACLGSATNQAGSFYFENDGYTNIYNVQGNSLEPGLGKRFNFAAPSYYQRPDERYTLGAFGHYELNEHVEAYTELMFMDNRTVAQFGPAGVFFNSGFEVNCGNPYLSAQQRDTIGCAGASDDTTVGAIFGRRNVEGGPRQEDLRHTTYRYLFGVRGDINETWRYDASWQYAEVDMRSRGSSYVNIANAQEALLATRDADGNIVCLSGGNCVPWNIWQTDGVTPDQTGWLNQQYFQTGTTDQEVFSAYVQGSLGDYGIQIPTAQTGIDVVLGTEYRKESLTYQPDDAALNGEVGGLGAALTPVDGSYDVMEFFVEASIPLVEGKTFMEEVVLDVGYRYSDYDPSGETTNTYKFAGSWAFDQDIKVRASYQRAVRAPNINDQFQPQQGTLFAMDDDPCGNVVNGRSGRGYTFEQCARTGVSQAVWNNGGPTDSPASQYNALIGGSTELAPEESDTYSVGFVFTPSYIDGLSFSLDWYDIEITDAISNIAAETTLIQCIENGQFCDKIRRGQNDSLWLGSAGPDNGIEALSQNIGFFRVKGIDVEINYNLDIGSMGSILFNNNYGYIDSWEQEEYPGAGVVSCEGAYGGSCGTPTIENRNRFSANWATPWDVNLNLTWRYIGEVKQEFTANPPSDLDAVNYLDLSGTWNVTDWARIRAGVSNITDEEPEYVPQGVTARENGNTFPGYYDALGQYWFVGATFEF
ncbi:TonB-dependent siderophore receptor [Halioglobus sp. HI00S01]|uniref:TonB-dependent receptor plug domain-containing protein n=1 Tax=Halioglobus sp. HI00S01 TaxID=1822214 RepID=UPI001E4BBC42|nr:TonB-dependent receptor [Halioglobus sp. HI00S01]